MNDAGSNINAFLLSSAGIKIKRHQIHHLCYHPLQLCHAVLMRTSVCSVEQRMALRSLSANRIATKFKATTAIMTMNMLDILLKASKKIAHRHLNAASRHKSSHRISAEEMAEVFDFYEPIFDLVA